MQRVTPDIGDLFVLVKKAPTDSFMPSIFQGVGKGILGQGVTCLTVKRAGMALLYLNMTAPENSTASCVVTGHLIAVPRDQKEFKTWDHAKFLR